MSDSKDDLRRILRITSILVGVAAVALAGWIVWPSSPPDLGRPYFVTVTGAASARS